MKIHKVENVGTSPSFIVVAKPSGRAITDPLSLFARRLGAQVHRRAQRQARLHRPQRDRRR
jgi:hypothetical protein